CSRCQSPDVAYCHPLLHSDPHASEFCSLSLHDALPICIDRDCRSPSRAGTQAFGDARSLPCTDQEACAGGRRRLLGRCMGDCGGSEEHTSELQSRENIVCRLLLETKMSTT